MSPAEYLASKSPILDSIKVSNRKVSETKTLLSQAQVTLDSTQAKLEQIQAEQALIEKTMVAIQQAKPLLSATSIKQCEELANSAISAVFGLPYTVEYNIESQRFNLNRGDFVTDLADSEGGGIVTVISAVFDLFLLVKMGYRRFMVYDEAWYAVSDQYYESFINFMRQACADLGVDILIISHDERLTPDMVDTVYKVEDGKTIKLK